MKKLVNRPEAVVEEMIEGLAAAYPGLRQLPGHTVLVRSDLAEPAGRQVAVISGGGSGHEPAHAGYVGRGMLSAAVAGDVFTSPSSDAVYAAIHAAAGPRGALLVVKSYTGDRLNFGLAAEMARADGIPVEIVLVADDVALAASAGHAGRRGLAGTVLVHKVAGALAERGAPLDEVAAAAREAAAAVKTMGVALSPCTVPAAGRPGFTLGDDEVELGLGIHGEPGVRRIVLESSDSLVDRLLAAVLADLEVPVAGRVVLMVNNLGATPTIELAVVARRALRVLEAQDIKVERVYVGAFLTALEMAGVSVTVMPVDDARLALLDAPTDAPAWPNAAARPRTHSSISPEAVAAAQPQGTAPARPHTPLGEAMTAALTAACRALIAEAARLAELDQAVGDGDLGISLERGARAVLEAMPLYPLDEPAAGLRAVSATLRRSLGGTSGPLYAAFLLRAAGTVVGRRAADPAAWAQAFRAGCAAVADLGGAGAGERTMLDALLPAADAFEQALAAGRTPTDALRTAAAAAAEGARATASMLPRCGRSSYLGERCLGHPDPGAVAVAVWLAALAPS